MKHLIIGTAGHVDHGKSALIKALTGTDTDRLKEEKLRGISIDLGFAALRLDEDITLGIVDVPGHERFLKNMLAGTGGIDMAMLVIAADEGVMPQTREHFAMLQLLGIPSGIVVLTKTDKVDQEWLELVEADVKQLVEGSFLASAPFARVSAVSGEGLEQLRQQLLVIAQKTEERDHDAPFRLWIDRSFSIKGYGTVVTGSALSGKVAIGDSLQVYPAGTTLRVRGLESHGLKSEWIIAGQRTAINMGGSDTMGLARGMVLSAPGRGLVSNVWDLIAEWQEEVASGTRVRLHLGTGEFLGRVYYYKERPTRYMRLLLEKPLPGGLGDRAILRLYSPQNLLGGVTLVSPGRASRRLSNARQELAEAVAGGNVLAIVCCLIADCDQPSTVEEIKRQAGYLRDGMVEKALADLLAANKIVLKKGYYLTVEMLASWTKKSVALIENFHQANPERAGLSKEILRQKLELKERAFDVLLDSWQKQGLFILQGAEVALQEFAASHNDWRETLVEKAGNYLENSGLNSIDWQYLAEKMKLSPEKARAAQEILLRDGTLIRVGDMHVYRKTIQYIAQRIRQHFTEHTTLTVAELRDMVGTSRKIALPLLEYFDMHKYTIREGDNRRPGPKLKDLSE
ncbi:MAG: selenocysteine-specific translation elongation factor [Negativicutes bacterium]|nr:selenocysteine-specific translation elongation factor [Negativicutes bacterium]